MGKIVDAALISRFQKEQLLDLSKRSSTSVVAHFALFVFVAFITPMKMDHPMILSGFGIVIFLISFLRMVLAKKIPHLYDRAPGRWTAVFMGMNFLSGILWGGGGGLIMALFYALEWPFLFTLVINCGLAAGATSSLGPHQGLSRNFTLAMLLPVTLWGFYNGSSLGIGMGILCSFSMFMFIRMAKDNYIWYWESMASNEQISSHTRIMERVFKGVNANAAQLNQTSKNLGRSSGEMAKNANEMSDQLSCVVEVAEQVTGNLHSMAGLMARTTDNFSNIASASEEMTATIADISQTTDTTRQITARAVSQSAEVMSLMSNLGQSVTAINQITEAIGDISEQINLLALNATIEAARAGDAGRGFAVVASEIKDLAVQTSGSAGEISRQVKEIQEATQNTAGEMDAIASIVQEANTRVEGIAKAVEEQSAATNEVSRNIQEASQGFARVNQMTGENDQGLARVAKDIAGLKDQARAVETGAAAVDQDAETLSRLAGEMICLVARDENK